MCFLAVATAQAWADQEASNRPYVVTDEWGQFYAKSVPEETYGTHGKTTVYQVAAAGDKLLHSYDWYAPRLFIAGLAGGANVYAVQFGPWHRGHTANGDDLAIAFHTNGALVRSYSTLDIAGSPENVSPSVSHYQIFGEVPGVRRPYGNALYFTVELHDASLLTFDLENGEIVTENQAKLSAELYRASARISAAKSAWFARQGGHDGRERAAELAKVMITAGMLRAVDQEVFSGVPLGHEYVPGTIWTQVKLQNRTSRSP